MLFRSTSQTFEQNRRAAPDLDFQVLGSEKHSWRKYKIQTNKYFICYSQLTPDFFYSFANTRGKLKNQIIFLQTGQWLDLCLVILNTSFITCIQNGCQSPGWSEQENIYWKKAQCLRRKHTSVLHLNDLWKSGRLDFKERADFHLSLFLTLCDLTYLMGIK